jgi:hypothetical protein
VFLYIEGAPVGVTNEQLNSVKMHPINSVVYVPHLTERIFVWLNNVSPYSGGVHFVVSVSMADVLAEGGFVCGKIAVIGGRKKRGTRVLVKIIFFFAMILLKKN